MSQGSLAHLYVVILCDSDQWKMTTTQPRKDYEGPNSFDHADLGQYQEKSWTTEMLVEGKG